MIIKYKSTLLALALGGLSLSASAFNIIDTRALKFAEVVINPGYGLYTVNDPDGKTAGANDFEFVSVGFKMPYFGKRQRTWIDFNYQYFELDASQAEIGQQVQRYKFKWNHQKVTPVSKGLSFWFGGGGSLGHASFLGRHTIDNEGFKASEFEDRNEIELGIIGSVALEYRHPRLKRYSFGTNAEYDYSLTGGVSGLKVGAYASYRF